MKAIVVLGVLVALSGMFSIAVFAEPTGVLAVVAGMFPFILVQS